MKTTLKSWKDEMCEIGGYKCNYHQQIAVSRMVKELGGPGRQEVHSINFCKQAGMTCEQAIYSGKCFKLKVV